jgi:DNA-binding winged helix-turn-helix (wHTH) protein
MKKLYRYGWKNNEKRAGLYDRECIIEASGKKNSVLIRFIDDGQQEIVSRNALKKVWKDDLRHRR